ncbi:adenylate kinase family protein [Methanobacterium sp. ACI-7]|uniref:adenylate kinase family protein n=1 Tax=unclassified Methanobacterium TaxID=2627676 RepID=UPI0039C30FBE
MIILITGTPGVGKTTVSKILTEKIDARLEAINEIVDNEHLFTGIDEEKGYKIVDLDALFNEMNDITQEIDERGILIFEGHLSHLFSYADIVVVLRANPNALKGRMETKMWKQSKINENIEAEAIAVCSYEAYEIHGEKTHEIDTSNLSPQEVADLIFKVIKGEKKFPVGNVDFLEHLV